MARIIVLIATLWLVKLVLTGMFSEAIFILT